MITYTDILYSITKKLSENFVNTDIIIQNEAGIAENECFYVQLIPISTTVLSNSADIKDLMISIKFFNCNRIRNYEMASLLDKIFNRVLKVDDRYLTIKNIEANILTDEVGHFLDYLITVNYVETFVNDIANNDKYTDLMNEINFKKELKIKK